MDDNGMSKREQAWHILDRDSDSQVTTLSLANSVIVSALNHLSPIQISEGIIKFK